MSHLNISPAIVAFIRHARILFPEDLAQQARWVKQQVDELRESMGQRVPREAGRFDFDQEPVDGRTASGARE